MDPFELVSQPGESLDYQEQLILVKLLQKENLLDKIIQRYTTLIQRYKTLTSEELKKDVNELLRDLDSYEFSLSKAEIQIYSTQKDLANNTEIADNIQKEICQAKENIVSSKEKLPEEIKKKGLKIECNSIIDSILNIEDCDQAQKQIDSINAQLTHLQREYAAQIDQINRKQLHVQNILLSLQELMESNPIMPIEPMVIE